MFKTLSFILLIAIYSFSTQWQEGILLGNPQKVGGINFSGDNLIMYGYKYNNDYWRGDVEFYQWNGTQWVWGGWLPGDVNTTDFEEEPFVSYDGQNMYFQRRHDTNNPIIYVADWNGSGFYNSRPLGSTVNNGNNRYVSITQDGQKLYYTKNLFIYESIWNGVDWNQGVLLPQEVNGGGGLSRDNVTISPDGNEIYFTINGYSPLSYSVKVGGIWQQWQYCDYNINPLGMTCYMPGFTYGSYETQELYYNRPYGVNALTYHSLRSPISVEPASLGQIKANYAR